MKQQAQTGSDLSLMELFGVYLKELVEYLYRIESDCVERNDGDVLLDWGDFNELDFRFVISGLISATSSILDEIPLI